MKRYCFILAFTCIVCHSWAQTEVQTIQEIKDFYVAYATNQLNVNSNNSLKQKYLTKSLIAKVDRVIASTGADPIIRAQDFSAEAIGTLGVQHLDKNWYMVSYAYVYAGKTDSTHIPVRISKTGGRCVIDYITPPWNGSLYGDSLLFDNPKQQPVDASITSTPLAFLKTFYAAYTIPYCSMSEDLTTRLAALRTEYLTTNAVIQFNAAIANAKYYDGLEGYDALIDDYDFDRLWRPSMTFSQLDDGSFQVSYKQGKAPFTITLKVIKQGKTYRISNIKAASATIQK